MSVQLEAIETGKLPDGYPYHIGTRLRTYIDEQGNRQDEYLPLTEEDFLHPQEEDTFMNTLEHIDVVRNLHNVIENGTRDLKHIRVFQEYRIDWQHETIRPHGPDVSVFEDIERELEPKDGTLYVKDVGARIVALFEVTSESTRHVDFGKKFDHYLELAIPYYIVIDCASPDGVTRILGFRYVRGQYREMREDPQLGFNIPDLHLWFRWQNEAIIVTDEDGQVVQSNLELAESLDREKMQVKVERERADAEKQRADALEAELVKLKAQLGNTPAS